VLKKENLIDTVAFAEIFNEFDGLPFVGEYKSIDDDKAMGFRVLHEKEIDKLKMEHPDVLFAFDTWTAEVNPELIPRNIDILNFHMYYAWSVYHEFEKDIVQWSLEEPVIDDETRYFLKDDIVSVRDIAEEMGDIKTGLDWPRRISLYASIDGKKMDELSMFLDSKLKEKIEHYRNKFREGTEKILATHDKVVPHSKIVMGEGLTYCASPELTFERDSEHFWQLINEQMMYFNEKGFLGTVISTTHAPKRVIAWDACKDLYIHANRIFIDGK